jgi:hypothetical protein
MIAIADDTSVRKPTKERDVSRKEKKKEKEKEGEREGLMGRGECREAATPS